MKKFEVILFQSYLRKFVLNFDKKMKNFVFYHTALPPSASSYGDLPSFEKEILRVKTHWKNRLRRFLGVPNIRPYWSSRGDLIFTYGTLVLTRKPYCTYIETGHALYNYDVSITRNRLARFLVGFLATRKNCKRLIFLSEAGRRSFFATVPYPPKIKNELEKKCMVIYPIPIEKKEASPKRFTGKLRLLFPGTFYIKGGVEVINAYEKLRLAYPEVSLTVVTAVHMLRASDHERMETIPGLSLVDARLNEEEMIALYQNHDIFVLPTYREGFGLVLIEALAYGLPLIITDQYATAEMAREDSNAFIYPNHPFKDYDPITFELFGKYYNPRDFYADLFRSQKENKLKPIEDFLYHSIEQFLKNPLLLEQYSKNSLEFYNQSFHQEKLTERMESVFLEAVKK